MQKKESTRFLSSNRKWLFLAVACVVMIAAACSSPNPATPQAENAPVVTQVSKTAATTVSQKVDACLLLTQGDVNTVVGQTVDAGVSTGLGGVCTYTVGNLSISLTVIHTGGTKSMVDTRAKLGADAIDVPGLGEDAFYNVNSYALFVRKGDAAYLFNYFASGEQLTDDARIAKEKGLAEQMLSHL